MGATRMEGEIIHSRGLAFSEHAMVVDSPCGRHAPRSLSLADARIRAFLVRGTRGHAGMPDSRTSCIGAWCHDVILCELFRAIAMEGL